MANIKWELIFINDCAELKNYLNIHDFIELSKLCKLARLKLKPKLFENIFISHNVDESINDENMKSSISEDCIIEYNPYLCVSDYIPSFIRYTQHLVHYTKCVNLRMYSNHYQLLEISRLLNQLTKLSISDIVVSLTAFNKSLINLQGLESLSIESTKFIHYKGESISAGTVSLPSSLKLINWRSCRLYLCDLESDPQLIKYDYENTLSPHSSLVFKIETFPKLIYFSSYLLSSIFNIGLLSSNPQITWLNYKSDELKQDNSLLFRGIQLLKTLEFEVDRVYLNLSALNLNLPNLKRLIFHNVNFETWSLLRKLTLSSPNLNELNIILTSYICPPIFDTINSIPNLRRLFILSQSSMYFNFDNFIPSKSLEYLELCFDLNINTALKILSKYSKLRLFCIRSKFFDKGYIFDLDPEKTLKPWKLVKIGNCLNYYK
jgi:hypothetical protein